MSDPFQTVRERKQTLESEYGGKVTLHIITSDELDAVEAVVKAARLMDEFPPSFEKWDELRNRLAALDSQEEGTP